jgi:putative inorganic carbon (hco3(-)) transporter
MSNKLLNKNLIKSILLSTILLSILIPFFHLELSTTIFLILTLYTIILSFHNNKLGFYLLILLRPCLDIFSNITILKFNDIALNFASILGVFTILFTIYIAAFVKTKKIKAIPLTPQIIIFLSVTLFSCILSISFVTSITEWLRLLNIFSLFALGFLLTNSVKDLSKLLILSITSAIIPSVFALYQFISKTGLSIPLEGIYNRIFGTFAHPNLFAYYLIIPLVFALFKFLSGNKKRVPNLMTLILFLFFLSLLVLTYTRGAWIVFIFTLSIISIFRYSYILPILFGSILLAYLTVMPIQTRVNDLVNIGEYNSIHWRIDMWEDGVKIAREKPVIGFGTGVADIIIEERRGKEHGSADPHNDYLKILLENGMLGLLSYFALIASILLKLYYSFVRSKMPKFKSMLIIMIALTMALYIMSFGDNIIRNTALQWLYWMLLGGIFAVSDKQKETRDET